jgi:hypothetical protein
MSLQNGSLHTGNRLSHGAGLDGHGRKIGQANHAGFRHPIGIMGNLLQVLFDPEETLGEQGFPHGGDMVEVG